MNSAALRDEERAGRRCCAGITFALWVSLGGNGCDLVFDNRELRDQDCALQFVTPAAIFAPSLNDPNKTDESKRVANILVVSALIGYIDCLEKVDKQTKPIYK